MGSEIAERLNQHTIERLFSLNRVTSEGVRMMVKLLDFVLYNFGITEVSLEQKCEYSECDDYVVILKEIYGCLIKNTYSNQNTYGCKNVFCLNFTLPRVE